MANGFFEQHRKTLDQALDAIRTRKYFSAYPEVPSGKIYGENAKAEGEAAFQARLNKPFKLDQPGCAGLVGSETSPYGLALGITYPKADAKSLVEAAKRALPAWRDAGVELRVGVCLEILDRLKKRSFEMANAVMHTTGQAFMMAFQAGGPHALDRGLEAVAYTYDEMKRVPESVTWEKPGKGEPIRLQKRYRILPRGVAVIVGVSTFPTWNSYPALFADLATGNPVIVKPHPAVILPLAITVEVARGVLREAGLDPNVILLAADSAKEPMTKELVTHPDVAIVDYTGGSAFGEWIEAHARQAVVFTEKSGVNAVIMDSVEDLGAVVRNLAFTLSLYSGQMCTTPQNIFVPQAGVRAGGQTVTPDDFGKTLASGIEKLLGDTGRAVEVLGAIQNEETLKRVAAAKEQGQLVLAPRTLTHPAFPNARVTTPVIVKVDAAKEDVYQREMFGPIAYVVVTKDTHESIERAARLARSKGAITCSVYSTDPQVLERACNEALAAGASTSCNLVGDVFVNQQAAFSDFHVSGANPAGNATLTDAAFVTGRFRVVQSRVPAPAAAAST